MMGQKGGTINDICVGCLLPSDDRSLIVLE